MRSLARRPRRVTIGVALRTAPSTVRLSLERCSSRRAAMRSVRRASEAAIGYREADRTRRSAKVGETMVRPNQRRARSDRGLLGFSRMPKRGSRARAVVQRILDAAVVCHVAHLIGRQPVAMPTMHWRVGERVYWHGSAVSRMLRTNEAGGSV